MSNFNDIISVLDTINKENVVSVYVPSLKKDVKFKGFTTGQQKLFLKAAVDNPVFQTRFIIACYTLLQENCLEKEALAAFTALDGAAILIQLRVSVYGKDFEMEDNNEAYKIDLTQIIEKVKALDIPAHKTINEGAFNIVVGAPSLYEQYSLEKQVRGKNLENEQTPTQNINDTIGEAFIGEVSKYIKDIDINVNGEVTNINYSGLPFTKKHQVLEKLPTSVVKGVITYIETITTLQKQLLTVTGTKVTDSSTKDVELTLNSALFAIG